MYLPNIYIYIYIKLYHPDRLPNATAQDKKMANKNFREVVEAYGTLRDDKKRKRYDVTGTVVR